MDSINMIIRKVDEDAGVHYQIHPAAMIFPEMTGDEWNKFVVDIRDNGQREPIIVHDGKVIDGRNRLRACRWLKIEPKVKLYHGREEDIFPYVLSLNLHRRHLTESQRAMVAAKLETTKHGRPGKDANLHLNRDQVAEQLKVSPRAIATAKAVMTKGEPEVQAAVESGAMPLHEASKVVQLRPEKQIEVSALPKAERRKTLAGMSIEDLQVTNAQSDPFARARIRLEAALADICAIEGSAEDLILKCPQFAAPGINKHFRQAFMKMQALNAAYQNWEYSNVNHA